VVYMNAHNWTYLSGSTRYCPTCDPYGDSKRHAEGCSDRWEFKRTAGDAECIARMGEAIATLHRSQGGPAPSAKVAGCSKPSPSCIEREWARQTSQGWQCLKHPESADRIPADKTMATFTDSIGTRIRCSAYREDAWVGGDGRQKTPKRGFTQACPDVDSHESEVRDWLTRELGFVMREGKAACSLRSAGFAPDLLTKRRELGEAARHALAGNPYDDSLDEELHRRMMSHRPWRRG